MFAFIACLTLVGPCIEERYPTETACVRRLGEWSRAALAWSARSHLSRYPGPFCGCSPR